MAVTVPGAPGTPNITVSPGTGDVLQVAAQIGALLSNLQAAGDLTVTSVTGGAIPPAPTTPGAHELIINDTTPGAAITIPAGYDYVVDIGAQGDTLTGSNVEIIGGTVGATYNVSGSSTIAASGSNTVSASGSYLLSFGPGSNLILANGSGTIATDKGTSTIDAAGPNNLLLLDGDLVTLGGAGETVVGGTGAETILSAGANELILGTTVRGDGSLTVTITGSQTTLSGLRSDATVTAAGSGALIQGGRDELVVTDSGAFDTVIGGHSHTTVTASAQSVGLSVVGGRGGLDFIGGPNSATVVTGSGKNSIAGGTGGLVVTSHANDTVSGAAPGGVTLFGSAHHSVTYTGGGNLFYNAGAGNETLNAVGSTGNNVLFASRTKGTHDRIAAGSGADTLIAGAGSDTLRSGPGADTFAFFSQFTAGAHEYVTHLTASDAVDLFGYGQAPKSTSTAHGSTTITLSDNTKITFVNVTNPSNIHYL
jgi:hypothetical protein